MIVVHHLENSRSQRVLWLLEELGVPYEVKRYERNKQTMQAPPELRAVHPLGKSPVITDGDLTLAETGAIVEYLCARYGLGAFKIKPGSPEQLAVTYWLHYAEGSAMPPFFLKLILLRLPGRAPAIIRPIIGMVMKRAVSGFIDPMIRNHLAFWESTLAKSPWFAGKAFTAADIMMSFPVEVAATRASVTEFPHIAAFLKAIHARPAYQRALDRGGPYGIIG